MRVMLIAPHYAEYSLCLARALAEQHEVLLVLNRKNFDEQVGNLATTRGLPRLKVEFTPHTRSLHTLVGNIAIYRRLFGSFRPDIVHCQEEVKDYMIFFIPLIGRRPLVVTVHDPRPHSGIDTTRLTHSRRGLYQRLLRQRADAVIVHGEAQRQEAQRLAIFAGKPIVSAPHGPLGLFNPLRSPQPTRTPGSCLFFGRIHPYKGLSTFVQAVALLRERGVPVHGVVAGRGLDLEHHRQHLEGSADFTLIERYLEPQEVVDQFDASEIVVLPYHEATQSGVAAYALGCGRPMVASRVGGLPDVVEDGGNGLLVPPQDPAALAAGIEQLLNDPALRARMGKHSRRLGQGRLSWQAAAEATTALYRRLLHA